MRTALHNLESGAVLCGTPFVVLAYHGIAVAEFFRVGDGRGLIELHAVFLRDVGSHRFGHALQGSINAGNRACTFGDGVGHHLNVAAGGVVKNKELWDDQCEVLMDGEE